MNQLSRGGVLEIESVVGKDVAQLHELRVEVVNCRSSSLRIVPDSSVKTSLLKAWEASRER
jgi:hypothetical protein